MKSGKLTAGGTLLRKPSYQTLQVTEERAKRVHCLLGFPLDMSTMDDVLEEISEATRTRRRLFISTVNLNFVTTAQTDEEFRNSLRNSDLCVADGMTVKLIGNLLGVPIPERVAGSDILSAIWSKPRNPQDPPLKVFFFGGTEEASQLACTAVNQNPSGSIVCVGNLYPGYGSIEDMSSDPILKEINEAKPDFLIVALGAKKGQAWIMNNQDKLEVPVISHLGATINFLAGTLKRAPIFWQRAGLEWLWRIKEEPSLAQRYWRDFWITVRLVITRVMPLAVRLRYCLRRWGQRNLSIAPVESADAAPGWVFKLQINGGRLQDLSNLVDWSSVDGQQCEIRLDEIDWMDTQSMGRLLVFCDLLSKRGGKVSLAGHSQSLYRDLRRNGLGDLLTLA